MSTGQDQDGTEVTVIEQPDGTRVTVRGGALGATVEVKYPDGTSDTLAVD